MKTILTLVSFAAVVLVACGRSDPNTPKEDATVKATQEATANLQGAVSPAAERSSAASLAAAVLSTNGMAYVRIKDFATRSLKDTTPSGDEGKLQFGDAVKLIQRKDGPVIFWLAAIDQLRTWISCRTKTEIKLCLFC